MIGLIINDGIPERLLRGGSVVTTEKGLAVNLNRANPNNLFYSPIHSNIFNIDSSSVTEHKNLDYDTLLFEDNVKNNSFDKRALLGSERGTEKNRR